MKINTQASPQQIKKDKKKLKILFAALLATHYTRVLPEIADIVNISEQRLLLWTKGEEWTIALEYWTPQRKKPIILFQTREEWKALKGKKCEGDLFKVMGIWEDVFAKGSDICSVKAQIALHPKLLHFDDLPSEVIGVERFNERFNTFYGFRKAVSNYFNKAIYTAYTTITLTMFLLRP